jgi:hypothetical protein
MLRLLIYILTFPLFCSGQSNFPSTQDKSKLYSKAIEEYLKAVAKNDKSNIDSLFVGQYDDLKDIKLPSIILNTKMVLLTNDEEGAKKLNYRKSYDYVNIAELKFSKDRAEIGFIRFLVEKSNGKVSSWPIHNGYTNFNYDSKKNQFNLDKVYFEYPYSNNYTVDFKVNDGKTNIYQDAIRHYIDSIHKASKLTFDTLFVLNNEFFPESNARNTEGVINKINIIFQDTAYISNRLKYHRSFMALNISDNQNSGKERIDISIISFLVTKDKVKTVFIPLKSCRFKYIYNQSKKEFEFYRIVCDY